MTNGYVDNNWAIFNIKNNLDNDLPCQNGEGLALSFLTIIVYKMKFEKWNIS